MPYATAAEVKAYSTLAEVAAKVNQDLTDKYIPRAQRIIDAYCKQTFDVSASTVLKLDGTGSPLLALPRRLASLSLLRFLVVADGGATITDSEEITAVFNKGWWLALGNDALSPRSRTGREQRNAWTLTFPCGRENIEVTGLWGYSAVPAEVKDATCAVVERMIASEGSTEAKGGVFTSERIGNYSYTLGGPTSDRDWMIPQEVRSGLRQYRKPMLPIAI